MNETTILVYLIKQNNNSSMSCDVKQKQNSNYYSTFFPMLMIKAMPDKEFLWKYTYKLIYKNP